MRKRNGGSGQGGPHGVADRMGRLDTLVPLMQDVATGQRPWQAFLDALSAALGRAAIVLVIGDGLTDRAPEVETARIDDRFRLAYIEHFALRDPWVERLTRRPTGSVGFGYETLPRPLLMASRFYTEWMKPQGLAVTPTIHAVVGAARDGTCAFLTAFRCGDGRSLEIEDLALIRDLMPELQQAVAAHRKRDAAGGS